MAHTLRQEEFEESKSKNPLSKDAEFPSVRIRLGTSGFLVEARGSSVHSLRRSLNLLLFTLAVVPLLGLGLVGLAITLRMDIGSLFLGSALR